MTALPQAVAAFDVALRRILTTCPADVREAETTSFARRYSQRGLVAELVSAVCASDGMMATCGKTSVQHPLGFDKLVLHLTDHYQLRLHVWWPEVPHGIEHVHNHRFSFVSGIVAGRILVAAYRPAPDGVSYTRFRETRDPGGGYAYQSAEPMRVTMASLQEQCTGCAYYLDSGELHRVRAARDGLAATLFIRLPENRDSTDVLVAGRGEPPVTGPRAAMGTAEARQRLERFLDLMSGDP